jgi:hypothetical protein
MTIIDRNMRSTRGRSALDPPPADAEPEMVREINRLVGNSVPNSVGERDDPRVAFADYSGGSNSLWSQPLILSVFNGSGPQSRHWNVGFRFPLGGSAKPTAPAYGADWSLSLFHGLTLQHVQETNCHGRRALCAMSLALSETARQAGLCDGPPPHKRDGCRLVALDGRMSNDPFRSHEAGDGYALERTDPGRLHDRRR